MAFYQRIIQSVPTGLELALSLRRELHFAYGAVLIGVFLYSAFGVAAGAFACCFLMICAFPYGLTDVHLQTRDRCQPEAVY